MIELSPLVGHEQPRPTTSSHRDPAVSTTADHPSLLPHLASLSLPLPAESSYPDLAAPGTTTPRITTRHSSNDALAGGSPGQIWYI